LAEFHPAAPLAAPSHPYTIAWLPIPYILMLPFG
jgi:hypothetical protein